VNRREFITLLGGAAVAWPLAARAQQGERMRRIGVLVGSLPAGDSEWQARGNAFVQGLQERGWSDGRNVQIEYRWAAGDAERIRKYATELVALAPDVILAAGGAVVAPLLRATSTVPIVFAQTAYEPHGVREAGGISLSACHPSRVQARTDDQGRETRVGSLEAISGRGRAGCVRLSVVRDFETGGILI
jgi:hypothetical protein